TREILNPQHALYENREQYVIVIYIPGIENEDQLKIRFSQAKKNLEISGEFQPLRSE
ncbi:1838_t:CDS:2, partial [Gigaspora rosea]